MQLLHRRLILSRHHLPAFMTDVFWPEQVQFHISSCHAVVLWAAMVLRIHSTVPDIPSGAFLLEVKNAYMRQTGKFLICDQPGDHHLAAWHQLLYKYFSSANKLALMVQVVLKIASGELQLLLSANTKSA